MSETNILGYSTPEVHQKSREAQCTMSVLRYILSTVVVVQSFEVPNLKFGDTPGVEGIFSQLATGRTGPMLLNVFLCVTNNWI